MFRDAHWRSTLGVVVCQRLCLPNFEQTEPLPYATIGLISNHCKALGPLLFRRNGPLFNLPIPGVAIRYLALLGRL
jgi:hypothetical protein